MKKKAWIPEWSKGSDLSSDAVSFVGSNPTSCIFSHLNSKNNIYTAVGHGFESRLVATFLKEGNVSQ